MADNSSNSTTSAAFMRTGDCKGELPKITLTGNSKVDISADDNRAKGQGGTSKTEAFFVDGKANIEGQAQIKIAAGKRNETMAMKKFVIYLDSVLDTLPDDKVEKLAEELREDFEIYSEKDLLAYDLEELDADLTTVKKAQKGKLLKHLREQQLNDCD